jgi:ATP-binding cassette subfamily B protein
LRYYKIYPIKEENLYWEYDAQFIHYQSLRNCIGIPQQLNLFSGSIIENIALGDSFPNMQGILDLSKELGITEFVEKLPNGFGTQIGENGAMLSGGQNNVLPLLEPYIKSGSVVNGRLLRLILVRKVSKKVIDDFKLKGKTSSLLRTEYVTCRYYSGYGVR